ncbi:MAG: hypothetical protein FIB07_01790 [Candidatus Methanoperedens sp.]|nr:hypothetical protein [Candidatus Methanoperedens sp.]
MKTNLKLGIGAMLTAMLLVSMSLMPVVNAQGQDSGGKPVLDNKDPLLYDAQIYASNNNVSTEEALRRFQLQNIPMPEEELKTKEVETFAGLWIEHTPEFKIVVQFTRNGEETIKQYLEQYPEFANVVEVRNTAKVSLATLQRDQANALNLARASDIPVESDINVYNNSVGLYMTKSDRGRFDDALLRREGRLSDKVRVVAVEAETMGIDEANIYGGLSLNGLISCTSGFSVKQGWIFITKGITTAGHCSDTQSYNGNSLTFQSEAWTGSYDAQWHTAPGYTVTNKIQWWNDGSTRNITATKSRNDQRIGEYVCKYGRTTAYTCGYISSKDFNPQTQQNNAATFIRVDNTGGYNDLSSEGDSGGPWFIGNTAYGTHKGAPTDDPNDAIYMAVDYLEAGLGVSVMTSP